MCSSFTLSLQRASSKLRCSTSTPIALRIDQPLWFHFFAQRLLLVRVFLKCYKPMCIEIDLLRAVKRYLV